MSAVSSSSSTNPYADLGLALNSSTQSAAKKSLGQDDFLKLMTTQLQYQDPFKPMENGEFLGQMAQFSTLTGIQDLQKSFSSLAGSLQSNQTLQASSMVGRYVMVPSSSAYLTEGAGLAGAIDVPASGNVSVTLSNASGEVVRTLDLGTQAAGRASFTWDGVSDLGETLPAGSYTIKAQLQGSGTAKTLDTYAVGHVDSVALDSGTLSLDLRGMKPASFNDVVQIF